MNLTVGEGHSLSSFTLKIEQTHCDHSRLLFFDIYKLDQTLLAAGLEIPSAVCGC